MSALLALLGAAASPQGGRAPVAIWRSSCAYCHQGSKVAPPIPAGIDPAALKPLVRNGSGAMPPFHRSEISDGELDALAEWIRSGGQNDVRPR